MRRHAWRWWRSHKRLTTGICVAAMIFVANLSAFIQARSMTHFAGAGAGSRTLSPERLGVLSKLHVLLTGVTVPRPVNLKSPADFNLAFSTVHTPSTGGIDLEMWHVPAAPAQPR